MKYLLLMLFSLSAHAYVPNWTDKDNRQFYLEVEKENGQWRADLFMENPGELQSRIKQKTFTNEIEAEAQARAWMAQYGYRAPVYNEDEEMAEEPVVVSDEATSERYEHEAYSVTEVKGEAVWRTTQAWNAQWEEKYREWLQANLRPDFFTRHNLATDCADVAISLRWIFARENGLPAGNSLAGSLKFLSNESFKKAWRGLSRAPEWYNDQVFLAALEYVLDNTFTQSLAYDGYPVAIKKESLTPGVFHLELRGTDGGHAMMLYAVKEGSGFRGGYSMKMIQSTLPREVRKLFITEYQRSSQPEDGMGGFLRMRWPVKTKSGLIMLAGSRHPDFSREQYEEDFLAGGQGFSVSVKKRLALKYDAYTDFEAAAKAAIEMVETRNDVVDEGYIACQSIDCREGTIGWDEWSTPSRDLHLKEMVQLLISIVKNEPDNKRIARAWKSTLATKIKIGRSRVTMGQVFESVMGGRMSPDPRDTPEKRWGL